MVARIQRGHMIALLDFPVSRDLTSGPMGNETGGQSFFVHFGQAW